MSAGGLTAILLTLFMELTATRRRRLKTSFSLSSLPEIKDFLIEFAKKVGWDDAVVQKLIAVAEEAMLTLIDQTEDAPELSTRHLLLTIQKEGSAAVMEVIVAPSEDNLEDQITLLADQADDVSVEREVSLRLLRHYASSVHHQQYHDTDILTMTVNCTSN